MKKFAFLPVLALILAISMLPAHAQNAGFFFRDGDRAQITGDSITEQRQYSTLIESFVLSRFPTWKISFRNTGWSGDTMTFRARGGQPVGLKRDILSLNPTAVTVDFGMNDGRGGEANIPAYAAASRTLVDELTKSGARVALITPSSEEKYEPEQPAGSAYNALLRRYSGALKEVATEKNTLFVDQLNPMISTIEAGRAANVLSPNAGGPRLIPDAVHPNWAGHLVMATHILKGLGAPSLVSSVEIDARTRATKLQKARLTDLKLGPEISFSRVDEALPWPLHPETKLALDIPGFQPLNELSRYELKVAGLPQPNYEIFVDEASVGTFTREQLNAGVNLSNNAGPISVQAQSLLQKISEKNNIFYERWRRVQLFGVPKWVSAIVEPARDAEMARLDAQIAALEAEINALRQPKSHVWTLKPVA